jgi:hypothetical protein
MSATVIGSMHSHFRDSAVDLMVIVVWATCSTCNLVAWTSPACGFAYPRSEAPLPQSHSNSKVLTFQLSLVVCQVRPNRLLILRNTNKKVRKTKVCWNKKKHQPVITRSPRPLCLCRQSNGICLGNLILLLPSEVAGSILTRNLTLQDISRLDTACCANEERHYTLKHFEPAVV